MARFSSLYRYLHRDKTQELAARAAQSGSTDRTAAKLKQSASNNIGIDPNVAVPLLRHPSRLRMSSLVHFSTPEDQRPDGDATVGSYASSKTRWAGHGGTPSVSSDDSQTVGERSTSTPQIKRRHNIPPISERSWSESGSGSNVAWSAEKSPSPSGYLTPDTEVDHSFAGEKASKYGSDLHVAETQPPVVDSTPSVVPAAASPNVTTTGKQTSIASSAGISTASGYAAALLGKSRPAVPPSHRAPLQVHQPAAPKLPAARTSVHPRKTVNVITTANDVNAIPIILALLHDCYLFVEELQRGVTPSSASWYRYLSMYIVAGDMKPFERVLERQGLIVRWTAMRTLLELRQRTLYASPVEMRRLEQTKGNEERFNLRWIVSVVFSERVVGGDGDMNTRLADLLRVVHQRLGTLAHPGNARDVVNRIRDYLKMPRIGREDLDVQVRARMTSDQRRVLIYDIVMALLGMTWSGFAGTSRFLSVHVVPVGCVQVQDGFSQRLVVARDVLCSLLPGPSPLTAEGAFEAYVRPVINQSTEWYFYNVVSPEERAYIDSGSLLSIRAYLEEAGRTRKEWRSQSVVRFVMRRLDLMVEKCYPHLRLS